MQDRARRPVDGILLSNIKARGLLPPNCACFFKRWHFKIKDSLKSRRRGGNKSGDLSDPGSSEGVRGAAQLAYGRLTVTAD